MSNIILEAPTPGPTSPTTGKKGAKIGKALGLAALAGTTLYAGSKVKDFANNLSIKLSGSPEEKQALAADEELEKEKARQKAEQKRQETEKEILKTKKETAETQKKTDSIKTGEDPDDKPFLRANNPWIIAPLAIAAGTALYREKRKRDAAEKEKAKLVDPNFKGNLNEPKTDSYKPPKHN